MILDSLIILVAVFFGALGAVDFIIRVIKGAWIHLEGEEIFNGFTAIGTITSVLVFFNTKLLTAVSVLLAFSTLGLLLGILKDKRGQSERR